MEQDRLLPYFEPIIEGTLRKIQVAKDLDADSVLILNSFFGNSKFISALDILDRKQCVCYIAKTSRRKFWYIDGGSKSSPTKYLCFIHYCSCYYFGHVVIKKEDSCCEHQLAVLLGETLGRILYKEIDENTFVNIVRYN
eukprot:TRINITY_DN1988_c0_g1_i4.p1 TRINITY_DN1988_c0_g1~~TRINITY_DN1988_c0_g1_i4.p1  ORF type:complete len:139 (-),score=2.26 TRINITY_DN1988_c0_g1_i4:42-458(-)